MIHPFSLFAGLVIAIASNAVSACEAAVSQPVEPNDPTYREFSRWNENPFSFPSPTGSLCGGRGRAALGFAHGDRFP